MRLRQRLWNPYVLVFLSSSCVMVIELVASRLIAPRVGVSLYTWTSVIGVILAGMSLGNYIGGRIADKRASTGLLGLIFALASLTTLAILWLNNEMHDLELPANTPYMVWIVIYIGAVFMAPSVVLGCVSPIIVKLSLTDLKTTGTTVGKIYAFSTAGSIVGTFATGFFLISYLGTKTTILIVASLLMVLAVWFLTDTPWRKALVRSVIVLALFGGGLWLLKSQGFIASECMNETNYFCINVGETDKDGITVRELTLDRLVHSYIDMDDPTHLVYGYEKTYAGVIKPLMDRKPDLSAFFIGGGGYTFPIYVQTLLPDSHNIVAEIDPGVTDAATRWLALAPDTPIKTFNMDARNYLAWESEPRSFDLVFGDAFNDFSVPFHLTTLEFTRMIEGSMREGGLYVANIIDGGPHGHFFRAYVRTLQRVFKYVVVIPTSPGWREEIRTTFVLAASQQPVDLSGVADDYPPLSEADLQAYLDLGRDMILTDDYVPVDNLMAPVVRDSFSASSLDMDIVAIIGARIQVIVGVALILVAGGAVLLVRNRKRRSMAP
jgi:spermidine synthase